MAYSDNELVSSADVDPEVALFPDADGVMPMTFAQGAVTIRRGTPVARNSATGYWTTWASGGSNETGIVAGFAYDDIVLDSDEEVLGQVMFAGVVKVDADLPLPAGQTLANLKTALKDSALRGAGIKAQGLGGGFQPAIGA